MGRIIILLIALSFPLCGWAQIEYKCDFNSESKVLTLTLTNNSENFYSLYPMWYNEEWTMSIVTFIYKDADENVLLEQSRLIDDDQRAFNNHTRFRGIPPLSNKIYYHKLSKWCDNEKISTVDFHLWFLAKIFFKSVEGQKKKDAKLIVEDYYKSFNWK